MYLPKPLVFDSVAPPHITVQFLGYLHPTVTPTNHDHQSHPEMRHAEGVDSHSQHFRPLLNMTKKNIKKDTMANPE